MKIARLIGPEDVRGALVPGPTGSNTQDISFAESFGKDMTAATEKDSPSERNLSMEIRIRRDAAGKSLTPAKTNETEAGKNVRPEIPPAIQIGKGNASSETIRIVSEMSKNVSENGIEQDAAVAVDGSPSKGKADGSKSSEGIPAEITERIASKSENSVAAALKQGMVPEGQDAAPTEEEPLKSDGRTSGITAELLDALQAGVSRSSREEAGHRTEEDKGDVKIRRENALHKPLEKGSNKQSVAADQAEDIQAVTVPPASEAIITAMVSPRDPTIGAAATVTSAQDSSIAAVDAPSRAGRSNLRKIQIAGAADSSALPKGEGVSKRPTSADSLPKESGPEPHEAKPSAVQRERADGNAALPIEKAHTALPEASRGVISTVTQVQDHGLTIPPAEKVARNPAHLSSAQGDAASGTPHFYGADEHKTLMANSTTLEVGLPGGTHGWLKIRAELADDGAVHASVSSNSSAGTEMLRRELPALTNYLHQEQVSVNSVVVHVASDGMNLSNLSGGAGQNHEAGRGSADGRGDSSQQSAATMSRSDEGAQQGASEEDGGAGWPSFGYAGAGGWLSVRA